MNLAPVLWQRFFDANGAPLAGGKLNSYAAGTTTPQVTYSNSTGTTNTNPVILDSSGYADLWLDPTLAYKFVLQDSNGNTLKTVDNVNVAAGVAGLTAWNSNTVYQQGALALDSSGQGLIYVSLINNNQNNALSTVSAWRIFAGNVRTVSSNSTLTITDNLVRSNSTGGNLTHTLPAISTTPIGVTIEVKDVGTGGNTTSLKGSGTDQIDGNNTYPYSLPRNGSMRVRNNGTSWDVVGLTPKNPLQSNVAPTIQKFTSGTSQTYYPNYVFFILTGSATVGATYTNNGQTFTVSQTASFATMLQATGTGTPSISGTLTKSGGTGDSTITFVAVSPPLYIRVKMAGGGGGGASSPNGGATGGNAGGNGSASLFGSLLTANGGTGGATLSGAPGAGGSVTVTSPAIDLGSFAGGGGNGATHQTTLNPAGGSGGVSPFGGAGAGGGGLQTYPASGGNAAANSGSGGGGGGSAGNDTEGAGTGGGAGGYIYAQINSPSTSYTYTVGSGGAGGASTSGTSSVGGNGAAGVIIVEEHYQ